MEDYEIQFMSSWIVGLVALLNIRWMLKLFINIKHSFGFTNLLASSSVVFYIYSSNLVDIISKLYDKNAHRYEVMID